MDWHRKVNPVNPTPSLTRQTALWYHRAILGEPQNPFSLTRAASSTRGAQKQIPISTCKRKVLADD